LTVSIQKAALAASNSGSSLSSNPIPSHIKKLLEQKRNARAQWQRLKYPADKSTLNHLKNKLNKAIQNYKNKRYISYIKNLSTVDNSIWKATKKLCQIK